MARFRSWAPGKNFAVLGHGSADLLATPAHRRRIIVFAAVFLPALVISLGYLFTRAPEYRAVARLQITPASVAPRPDDVIPVGDSASRSFLTEVQILTSRPLLETVVAQMKDAGQLQGDVGSDPVDSVQRMLSTEAVEGTQVVLLNADGARREFLAPLVNQVVGTYEARLEDTYKKLAAGADADLTEELRVLDEKVEAKRSAVDAFRARYDIVSLERDENQVLTRLKGLGAALNEANDQVAKAEGHLKALRDSTQAVVRAKDNPTVADLEKRASQMREDLKELGRRYTPQYLDLDPDVKALKARLADVEQQTQTARASSQKTELLEAQQELASARESATRLKQELDDNKQAAQEFTTRFGEYKALQNDLDQLDTLHRSALERLAKLEARERESAPRMTVLEAAARPVRPWRPLYALDSGLSLVGSLLLGFFAVWFVEFFSPRAAPEPALVIQDRWRSGGLPIGHDPGIAQPLPLMAAGAPRLLANETSLRELSGGEIGALLRAASDQGRLALVGLLSGFRPGELIGLRWSNVDLDAGAIHVTGDSARSIPLEEPIRRLVAEGHALQPEASDTLLRTEAGRQLSEEDLNSLVMYAAYDAALDRAEEITPRALRHTYISFLIRQGIRLSDIGRIVGRIPQDELLAYMRLGSPEARLPFERIERVLPALRDLDRPEGASVLG
jgi:succinoglycan biosynthesis transport protein ExoP